jgi:septal ring-binding cell division protein DamX
MRSKSFYCFIVLLILVSCSDNSPGIKKVIVKDNSARLVDNPRTKSPITFIPIGTELEVLKTKDVKKGLFNTTWFQVPYEDTVGWINMFFVTVDSNATVDDMIKLADRSQPDAVEDADYDEDYETDETFDYDEYYEDEEITNDTDVITASQRNVVQSVGSGSANVPILSSIGRLYTVQITSGKNLAAAEELVRNAKNSGIDAYIQQGYVDNSGTLWYRVRAGKYTSIDIARAAAGEINEKMNANSWVDNFRKDEVVEQELIPAVSEPLESLPMYSVIEPWIKENISNSGSIKYIKWYDPYIRGNFHLQRVRYSILTNQDELLIDEREFKFWDGKLYSVFDNLGTQLQ